MSYLFIFACQERNIIFLLFLGVNKGTFFNILPIIFLCVNISIFKYGCGCFKKWNKKLFFFGFFINTHNNILNNFMREPWPIMEPDVLLWQNKFLADSYSRFIPMQLISSLHASNWMLALMQLFLFFISFYRNSWAMAPMQFW